jgi:hypothetical protein
MVVCIVSNVTDSQKLQSQEEVKASRTTIKVSRTTKMSAKIEPHRNDVLLGRGGRNNQHSGNAKLREISKLDCEDYRFASKKGKSNLSRGLVDQMKALSPAGRYVFYIEFEYCPSLTCGIVQYLVLISLWFFIFVTGFLKGPIQESGKVLGMTLLGR